MTQTNIPFNVGDRVLATGRIDGNELTGKYGTVIAIEGEHISVQFDERIIGGHDCHRQGKNGHCWFCKAGHLQILVDDGVEFEESAELTDFIQGFKCV